MDQQLLVANGLHPKNPFNASAPNYQLIIGERATLIPSAEETAYGVVMELDEGELLKLYGEASVKDYEPVTIEVINESQQKLLVDTYLLPESKLAGSNPKYAALLVEKLEKRSFPSSYIDKVKAFIK
ncbi:gamma-glutamylcyclotransferase [Pleionea sp. CnH1-48]|nr:gamma-glutamylcyclotransferase [Pleionea sp. CnH1-48]